MHKLAFPLFVAAFATSTLSAADPSARVASTGGRSPHETTSTTIGGRSGPRVTITYGRPGTANPRTGEVRTIWGGLVPWDKAWRLGADEATLLLTQKPLMFGATTIPAGAYTLYMVPSETGASKLAFSSNLGKWGVPVDETTDVARIELTKNALETPIDRLTMAIENDGSGGGVLKISWEKTQFAAGFKVGG